MVPSDSLATAELRQSPPIGRILLSRGSVEGDALKGALQLQVSWGSRIGEILLARGQIDERALAYALADQTDLPVLDTRLVPNREDLAAPSEAAFYAQALLLPWTALDGRITYAAVDPLRVRSLLADRFGAERIALALMTKSDLLLAVERLFGPAFAASASEELFVSRPHYSARTRLTPEQKPVIAGGTAAMTLALAADPISTLNGIGLIGALGFTAILALRAGLAIAAVAERQAQPSLLPDDTSLPVYTVLVPLYREAPVVPGLASALRALDYPAAKLDIKLIVEADDRETRTAIEREHLPPTFEILAVPPLGPRTKPKACNYALHYARGEFVVIYDAEDRPEPTQLRQAVAAFRSGPAELGCVQARLNYFNATENWLTRQFSIEYSFWFDLMLPGLQRLGLPIPLGGTSNHFPCALLRRLGAWDPYNVTEDADLGIRLAQEGYRCEILNSTTYEEATCRWGAWTRQRTRWIKGYIQTYLVHMRRPGELYASLGGRGFLGFQLVVGGTVAAALLHPLWIVGLATSLSVWLRPGHVAALPELLCLFLLVIGNICSIAASALALVRRGDWNLMGSILFIPAYWLLVSVAAYRAVWHWLRRPSHWEKTEHGVTRIPWMPQPASSAPETAMAHASASASPPKRRMRSVRLRRAG